MSHPILQSRPPVAHHKSVLGSLIAIFLVALAVSDRTEAQTAIDIALETPNLEWEGEDLWTLQTEVSVDNEDALVSNPIEDEDAAFLAVALDGPLTGSFWWKVSSEEEFDYLYFAVDGEILAEITGEIDWIQVEFELSPGSHDLEWVYEKDDGGSDGQDKAWIDQLELVSPNVPLKITQQPTAQTVQIGQSASFSVSVEGSGTIAYQWFKGEEQIPGAKSPTYSIGAVTQADSGSYSVFIVNENEEAQSSRLS